MILECLGSCLSSCKANHRVATAWHVPCACGLVIALLRHGCFGVAHCWCSCRTYGCTFFVLFLGKVSVHAVPRVFVPLLLNHSRPLARPEICLAMSGYVFLQIRATSKSYESWCLKWCADRSSSRNRAMHKRFVPLRGKWWEMYFQAKIVGGCRRLINVNNTIIYNIYIYKMWSFDIICIYITMEIEYI